MLGVARDAGRPACRDALNKSGIKVSNPVLEQAVRQRKTALQLPGAAPDGQGSDLDAEAAPTAAPDKDRSRSADCPGQSEGSGGSPAPGYPDDLPPRPSLQGKGKAVEAPDWGSEGPCRSCGDPTTRYGGTGSPLCRKCSRSAAHVDHKPPSGQSPEQHPAAVTSAELLRLSMLRKLAVDLGDPVADPMGLPAPLGPIKASLWAG